MCLSEIRVGLRYDWRLKGSIGNFWKVFSSVGSAMHGYWTFTFTSYSWTKHGNQQSAIRWNLHTHWHMFVSYDVSCPSEPSVYWIEEAGQKPETNYYNNYLKLDLGTPSNRSSCLLLLGRKWPADYILDSSWVKSMHCNGSGLGCIS